MKNARRFLCFFLVACASCAHGQQTGADALHLLDRVAKHYQDAETLHLEATVHYTSHNDLDDSSQTSMLSATIAPGGRFRYEGKDFMGSGLIVSDGTNEWRLLRGFEEYTERPTGTYFAGMLVVAGDDRSVNDAHYLITRFNSLGAGLSAAHFASEESIVVNGREVRCTVVRYGSDDFAESGGWKFETTLWIDAASLTLLKEETRSHGRFMYGTKTPPFGSETESINTTTYTTTQFNFEPKPDTFTFVPPEGSKEVAELPAPFPNSAKNGAEERSRAAEKLSAEHIGKPLPTIVLHDTDGHEVPLSRYLGHPLLIDLWATWCGPCLNELPVLNRLSKSTSQTDLKIIGIDEDSNSGVALSFLKRKGYNWEDFHFNKSVTTQLSVSGIPLIVLVDAKGNIVYYHTGAEDAAGLAQAIAKLGKAYESASTDR